MTIRVALRILYLLALGVAVLSLGFGALGWLQSHSLAGVSGRDLANFLGLVSGVMLGGVLLWASARSAGWSSSGTVVLYVCWIAIFGWYWFNRFGAGEIHSFDPQQVEVERIRQMATSAVFFIFWVVLCSIGPFVMVARKLRH
jgi:hypothetical protein